MKSIETVKIGNLGEILERCDRMKIKKKVDSELSLRELKKYSTKSIDIKMIATAVTTNKPTFYIVSL